MWIVDHEDDVASDLSAFHRVDDPMTLPAVRYFSLAERLTAYAGVMGAIAAAEHQKAAEASRGGHAPAQAAERHVSEEVALAQLADGWLEHTTEEV